MVTLTTSARRTARTQSSLRLDKTAPTAPTAPTAQKLPGGAASALPQGLLRKAQIEQDAAASLQGPELGTAPPLRYSTTIQEVRDNMDKFANCVVLTRVGGFYELYFEHAERYGPLLGIKVGARRAGQGSVPLAGFPWMHLDRYLKVLVQDHGCYVAISEEFRNTKEEQAKSNGLTRNRRVTRVVTPGTLIDEKFLDPTMNNFCLALSIDPQLETRLSQPGDTGSLQTGWTAKQKLDMAGASVGLAWVDLSTGEFFVQKSPFINLASALTSIGAKEILLSEGLSQDHKNILMDMLGPEQLLVSWQPSDEDSFLQDHWTGMLDSPIPEQTKLNLSSEEIRAGSMVLKYLRTRLQDTDTKLQPPVRRLDSENMSIDRHTLRGLEVLDSIRGAAFIGAKGSLLHAVRRTVTESGARLLRDRIARPSAVLSTINQRLDLVEELVARPDLNSALRGLLTRTSDSQRLVQKFALGRGDPDDLVSLSKTITLAQTITEAMRQDSTAEALLSLIERFSLKETVSLSQRIANAIDEDGLLAAHEQDEGESSAVTAAAQGILASEGNFDDIQALGSVARVKTSSKTAETENDEVQEDTWIMRKGASDRLSQLHSELESLTLDKQQLLESLRRETGATSLTLKWQPNMGHYCHVRRAKDVKRSIEIFPDARADRSSKSTVRSFHVKAWTELGGQLDAKKVQIREEEQRIFGDLRLEVVRNLVRLRRNAAVFDELDVACSSAVLAVEQHSVRPSLDNGRSMEILGGRHPTVTLGLEEKGRLFVANDCFVNTSPPVTGEQTGHPGGEFIHLVTGPNMAGKSTFLRQNALFAIMAQVGLFVPATYAHIGIVDALFARIGSADNLFGDQSTFMIEMLEVGAILRDATPRSLVIMDEVGRGTTPADGLAVAFGTLSHLKEVNRCRTLFATHFHALADLTSTWDPRALGKYCTDVQETDDGGFVFLHKVRPGVNRKSHALKVAGMAGVPKFALDSAERLLKMDPKLT